VVGGIGEPVDVYVNTGAEGGRDDVWSHLKARDMAALPGKLLGGADKARHPLRPP
jgi:hypothetical protein